MSAGRGFNTFHGFDQGPPPPGFAPNQPYGVTQYPGFYGPPPAYPVQQAYVPSVIAPPPPVAVQHPTAMYPTGYPTGYHNSVITHPVAAPIANGNFPGINFRNPTGGVGLPPGYDYLFPSEHCTVHAFQTGSSPPWQAQLPMSRTLPHVKIFVPVNTTVKEMMQRLGCNNDDPKKNVLHEVTEKGNGQWAKGLTISGDDKDRVKKKISDFGWDKSRTGFPGQRPVVWLYLTKD